MPICDCIWFRALSEWSEWPVSKRWELLEFIPSTGSRTWLGAELWTPNPPPPLCSASLDRRYHLPHSLLFRPSICCAEYREPAGPAKLRTGPLGARTGRLTWMSTSAAICISAVFPFPFAVSFLTSQWRGQLLPVPTAIQVLVFLFKNLGEETHLVLTGDLESRSVWRSGAVKVERWQVFSRTSSGGLCSRWRAGSCHLASLQGSTVVKWVRG
jgi:hypothetical protein